MRRNAVIALLAAVAAFVAAISFLRRPGREPAAEEAGPDPRAEELRRTLAEARRATDAGSPGAQPPLVSAEASPLQEAPAQPPAAVSEAIDAERRRVHEAGRRAVEEMQAEADEPAG